MFVIGLVVWLVGDLVVVDFDDVGGQCMQEVVVMGNKYYVVVLIFQECFELVDGFDIEVVGWFVQ